MNLESLLAFQKLYNEKIREEKSLTNEEWTQTYLLGIVSEIDEVLREISWKRHRKNDFEFFDRTNLGYEFADLFKYVLSLFELWGFDHKDIERLVEEKSWIVEERFQQEFLSIPSDVPIIITDIDGTLGDWRKSFDKWLTKKGIHSVVKDPLKTLRLDEDLLMRYPDYYALKEEFEGSGGYQEIDVYPDAVEVLTDLNRIYRAFVIAVTARPANRYKRIWIDTWKWLSNNGFPVGKLLIGSDPRVLLADSLQKNQQVIMLEDDPGLILRGANSGIKVIARSHSYNIGIEHPNVRRVNSYRDIPIDEYFNF